MTEPLENNKENLHVVSVPIKSELGQDRNLIEERVSSSFNNANDLEVCKEVQNESNSKQECSSISDSSYAEEIENSNIKSINSNG